MCNTNINSSKGINIIGIVFKFIIAYILTVGIATSLGAQTFNLQKSVSTTTPTTGQPFDYIIDASCNSTTRDCETAVIVDCLPSELEYLNVSDPLPDGVSSAIYDPNTHCVTIRFNAAACASCTPDGINTDNDDFAQGSTVQLAIQVRFPSGTFSGTTANNTANGTSNNAGNPSDSAPTVTASGGNSSQTGCNQILVDADMQDPSIAGGDSWIRNRIDNLGTADINNYSITVDIPNNSTFSYVQVPSWPANNHTGTLYYQRSDQPGTWINWTTFNTSTNGNDTYYVGTIGLPAGITVTDVRMDLGTLSGDGSWNRAAAGVSSWESTLRVYNTIDAGTTPGTTLSSCTNYSGTVNGTNCSANDCTSATVIAPFPSISGGKAILDINTGQGAYTFAPGDRYLVNINFASDELNGNDIIGGVMVDVLPPGMTYVPGSWYFDFGEENIQFQQPVIQDGYLTDGRQWVRFVWDASLGNEFTIAPDGTWKGFGIYFEVQISTGISTGRYSNEYYYTATGSDHGCESGNYTDPNNYTGGYAFDNDVCYNTAGLEVIRPPSSAGLESYKEVLGTKDSEYHRYPTVGETVPGGLNDYRICLTNPNSTPINDIVLIDILPHIGDTEVLNNSVPRSSEWEPILSSGINPPSGISVQYSTATNPCRNELASPSDPLPFPTGCTSPNWTSTAPTDISTVTAVRFDFGSMVLNQSDQVCIEWDMRAPIGAPTDGSIAWNSFAYSASNASTGSKLLPAEPIKVGISLVPGTVPIKGDFVWDDTNGNGLQDAGEPGIDGVTVNLYRDSNNNGIAEPNSDQLYTYTISQAGGQYIFSDFPVGDYFIEFTDFPSGYNPTHTNAGGTGSTDSDGPITQVFTVVSTTDNRDCDFGLYFGSLPPLCDLDVDLETGASCSVNLSLNPGFENSGPANFNTTYQGVPAAIVDITNPILIPNWQFFTDPSNSGSRQSYYLNDVNNVVNNPEGDKFVVVTDAGYCYSSTTNLTAGQCYNITFMAAAFSNSSATGEAKIEIALSGLTQVGNTTLNSSNDFNNMDWQQVSATFTPTETRDYNIYISSGNLSGTFNGGIAIDDYVISECCNTICSGDMISLTANATSSNDPISYQWSNSETTPTINVSPTSNEVYEVTVTDANNCEIIRSVIVNVNPNPIVSISNISNVTCNAQDDGSLTATASNGVTPYTYNWSNGSTGATINGLSPGNYSVTVIDANGCEDVTTAIINEPEVLSCSVVRDQYVECDCGDNGQATVTAIGGNGGYSYLWSNGETTQQATQLGEGTHTVTVTDSENCQTTCTIDMEIDPGCCFNIMSNGFLRNVTRGN